MTNDDDLRTALTKLADKWLSNKDRPSDYQDGVADAACAIRALLAAHPAPGPVSDTRREDAARALLAAHIAEFEASVARLEASIQDPVNTHGGRLHDTAKLHGQRGAVYALRRLAEALAVLPAPPVVDEAEIRDQAREARHRLHEEQEFFSWSDQSDAHDTGYVAGYEAAMARLRGATHG